jgi:hypothetical protein
MKTTIVFQYINLSVAVFVQGVMSVVRFAKLSPGVLTELLGWVVGVTLQQMVSDD